MLVEYENSQLPFSITSTDLLSIAKKEALAFNDTLIKPEYILMGLLNDEIIVLALKKFGVDTDKLKSYITSTYTSPTSGPKNTLHYDFQSLKALDWAGNYAKDKGSEEISPAHILRALIVTPNSTVSTGLSIFGVTENNISRLLGTKVETKTPILAT